MKETFAVINQMVADGAIENYAIAGAIGAMFYVEPFSTEDLDVFVLTPDDRLVIYLPGWEYLKARGYSEIRKEGIVVEGWTVQFMPVNNPLEREAYVNAQELDYDGINVRVVLPEHLVAIMLKVGRLRDLARVEMFLNQKEVDLDALEEVIQQHDLSNKWVEFKNWYDRQR
ncbi:MAG TPA: hypothetical protein VEL78_08690 [Pyrinomonadaceae bacterium]|nr:hypothetical protein [Pyrinomonadaceae bacterium]